VANLRKKYGLKKFAIVDTDHHHGDGTRNIFEHDRDLLHICMCTNEEVSGGETNIDIRVPISCSDELYLALLAKEGLPRLERFQPEMIFWEFGYDTTRGDYGDIGLSEETHLHLTTLIKEGADLTCDGNLVVILCGGSSPETADYCIPRMIEHLAA
jgi:acetoin utilization deacetylase AcuC-like enzyme